MPTNGAFTLTSSAFAEGGSIPKKYTCQGADVSPPLAWMGQPSGTAQLLLIVDDTDAGGFVHWIVAVGSDAGSGLAEDVPPNAPTSVQGVNGFGRVGYGGPCPPSGTHHYRFTVYALATALQLSGNPTISQVRAALPAAHVLGQAVLTGTYRKG